MNNKKIMGITSALALALVVSSPAFAETMMTSTLPAMTSTTMPSMTGSMNMMINGDLHAGSRGDSVLAFQTFLISNKYLASSADGRFGPLTKAAAMKYQLSVGLKADGYVGPLTRAAYAKTIAMMSSSMNTQVGVMVGGALMTPDKDIVQNAVNANNVTTVVAAVKAAGLVSTLEGAGPFTVFAPDNNAFAKLPAGTVANLLLPANLAQLKDILTYHVVVGRYTTADLYDGQVLTTVEGKTLKVAKSASGKITINGTAMIETPNVISLNGVTHVIDTVLTPGSN